MPDPSIEQLMRLIEQKNMKQQERNTLAQRPSMGQPIAQGDQSRWDVFTGQGGDAGGQQAMGSMMNAILNRKPGQSGIGAAGEGFSRGREVMDSVRARQKAEELGGFDSELSGMDSNMDMLTKMLGMRREDETVKRAQDLRAKQQADKDEQTAYDRAEDAKMWGYRQEQQDAKNEEKTYAGQRKAHETLVTDWNKSRNSAMEAATLSDQIGDLIASGHSGGGRLTKIGEWAREEAGNRELESRIRTKAAGVINRALVGDLPPGIASDKDIELVKQGYPEPTASLEELKEFTDAIARIQTGLAKYNKFAAQYVGSEANGKPRYSMVGLIDAWEQEEAGQAKADTAAALQSPGASVTPAGYTVVVSDD